MKINTLRIGVIGAGFSGAALAACLHKLNYLNHHRAHIEIFLCEKRGTFGLGEAYSTPYPFHLLNVRANDMSVFEDQPGHFAEWLKLNHDIKDSLDKDLPFGEQFAPRILYGKYMRDLLRNIQVADAEGKCRLHMEETEVIDVNQIENQAELVLADRRRITVDKVVIASGNSQPQGFPFPVSGDVKLAKNPWDYRAPEQIDQREPVLIVGTGLSMIDTVLTLHHQGHEGKIYGLSRHGLLPLSHSNNKAPAKLNASEMPRNLRQLMRYLRAHSKELMKSGGDWRAIINAFRLHVPQIWAQTSISDRERFLRHGLPYWNIHRHRVHSKIADLLADLQACGQMEIIAGRVLAVENGAAKIQLRHSSVTKVINITWLINCMGPSLSVKSFNKPLEQGLLQRGLAKLDDLQIGFSVAADGALLNAAGQASTILYAVGPPRKSICWESGAVPEIRKQCFDLAKQLLQA